MLFSCFILQRGVHSVQDRKYKSQYANVFKHFSHFFFFFFVMKIMALWNAPPEAKEKLFLRCCNTDFLKWYNNSVSLLRLFVHQTVILCDWTDSVESIDVEKLFSKVITIPEFWLNFWFLIYKQWSYYTVPLFISI